MIDDPYLSPYREVLERRAAKASGLAVELSRGPGSLAGFACAHEYYGLHLCDGGWIFREYAPAAVEIFLVGDFSDWQMLPAFALRRNPDGVWEGGWPRDAIFHGQRYHLRISWKGGSGERIPAYARRIVQDPNSGLFEAQVWEPHEPYRWRNTDWRIPRGRAPLIYEAHIGMAEEKPGIGTYAEFRENVLPRIAADGYNAVQIMALAEHPYYGSFGYHVGGFFAASSRFGTPEQLKELVDAAHSLGIAVLMDVVHSHAVRNERDGLSRFDGTEDLYFHSGSRGWHSAWDSRCFDYGKTCTLHFLLSNIRYWLDEFHVDGFRFDGITSMLYRHHGLSVSFTDYSMYFGDDVDEDAWAYCNLANRLVRELRPDAITIAEDVSGMPGLASAIRDMGAGFCYRMAMGVTDCWFKLIKDVRDEDWDIGWLWSELTNRRREEKTVSYVECHDQSLVGGKSLIFEMMDAAIYDSMHRGAKNPVTDRAVALHKMARLATAATAGGGYLNFMGNEFGHPEWIDFPREGNGNSFEHARRQWSLVENKSLFFSCLGEFDKAMLGIVSRRGFLASGILPLACDGNAKMFAFLRGDFVFVFNFSATTPLVDFPVMVPPGKYMGALNTDTETFGGFGRIAESQEYPVFFDRVGNEVVQRVRVYLPPRTAVVLKRGVK